MKNIDHIEQANALKGKAEKLWEQRSQVLKTSPIWAEELKKLAFEAASEATKLCEQTGNKSQIAPFTKFTAVHGTVVWH